MVNSSFVKLSSITPFLPESPKIWLEYLSVKHGSGMPLLHRHVLVKRTSMNSLWPSQGSLLICKTENNIYSLRLVLNMTPLGSGTSGSLHTCSSFLLKHRGVFPISKASESLSKVSSGHATHVIDFSTNYNNQ